ncbi:pre-rRNA 2'-O-ribose RNA methyltransferase FTSJ3 [Dermacentor variabilis]|uniref:pre-rRNA 2'-O-ribose RNA methyltransferase FTSJ3 n=1 Tax=Dermacentor variabilis TaxID=34621 RepID=UPI003F5BB4C5
MGKKTKTGKQRKDKFYHLAKETGFRSRAAFKLIQLNRKFEFLQRSRVLIDLCAAPGGWLQVAQKYMPVSSVIIGVDLVPIRPIPNVIAIQDDITTGSCRTKLKKELKTWKADIVLNDGAPNVGKSWDHDAYGQNVLTLHAVKLATEFLNKGGWFITKVFRSKDYQALMWVLKKLFKKISATKPQASRHESAEIFVVCQSYIAPDKIDPRFLDPAHLFSDVDTGEVTKLNPAHPEKQKPKAEGYPENDYTLYHTVPVMDFLKCENHLEVLGQCSEVVIDNDEVLAHPLTTQEIKECCKDIKVLGRGDIKNLLTWRKKLKAWLEEKGKKEGEETEEAGMEEVEEETDDEELQLLKHAEEVTAEQARELKKKKKKVLKQRNKLRERMNLQMVLKNDQAIVEEDLDLFKLKAIKNEKQLSNVDEVDVGTLDPVQPLEDDEEDVDHRRKLVSYKKNVMNEDWYAEEGEENGEDDDSDDDEHEELVFESDAEEDANNDEEEDNVPEDDENPLLVDVAYGSLKNKRKEMGKLWFEKEAFADIDDEKELLELEMMSEGKEKSTATPSKASTGKQKVSKLEKKSKKVTFADAVEVDTTDKSGTTSTGGSKKKKSTIKTSSEPPKKKQKRVKLDPEGLAIGTMMIRSQKAKRDIIDAGFNRYAFNDDNLPKWFVEEEQKHSKKMMPETAEMVAEYKAQLKAVNARPIKKVAEAKARKKLRAARKLEKARKRAETITEKLDMTDAEKAQQIRQIYKKVLGKKENDKVTYLVAKKATGRKVRRPPGVKGRFKVVDPRMKKDLRKKKAEMKKKR